MKLQNLQKTLIKEGAFALGAIAVCAGIYIGVSSWASSKTGSVSSAESKVTQQQSEITSLRNKIDNAGTSQKNYASIVEQRGNENFAIDNQRVRDVLVDLVRRYRVEIDGKLEYSAEEKMAQPQLANLTSDFVLRKDAKLTINAISDMHVYAFLDALAKELPGVVQYTDVTIKRTAQLNHASLSQLALGKQPYLVNAVIDFDWYGISPKATPKDGQPAESGDVGAMATVPGAPPAARPPGGIE